MLKVKERVFAVILRAKKDLEEVVDLASPIQPRDTVAGTLQVVNDAAVSPRE